jgi:hypothetical protein
MECEIMVDVSRAMESSYVDVDLVRESPTKKCVILDEGDYLIGDYQGKKYEKFELLVEIDKKQKKWCPNRDTVHNISAVHGKDSASWPGKIIMLQISKKNGKDIVLGLPLPTVNI